MKRVFLHCGENDVPRMDTHTQSGAAGDDRSVWGCNIDEMKKSEEELSLHSNKGHLRNEAMLL